MVKLLNVYYQHPSGGGISGVSLEVGSGEFVLIQGRTGAGKTTLFKLLMKELLPDSGEIYLDGMQGSKLKRRKLPDWRRYLGMVFQDSLLMNDRSVLENVQLAALCERRLKKTPKQRALAAIGKVGMAHKLHALPSQLSSGEQQRVGIARAIVNEPFVLLADEPLSNLDSTTASEVVGVLQQINRAGTSVIVASHQPERFTNCRARYLFIERGQVAAA